MSFAATMTPPTSYVFVPKGLRNCCGSPPHFQITNPLIATRRPMVTITIRSTFPRSTGRMTTRWMPTPPANEIASVATKAGQ